MDRTAPTETAADADEKHEPDDEGKKKRPFWRELPVLIVVSFAAALVIKTFLLQAFYIPSASMEPTLHEGDRVLVEKVGYRFGEPDRGDVVVFERQGPATLPSDDGDGRAFPQRIVDSIRELFGFPTGGEQDFIKRVIAVEGDSVRGRSGRVFVNGEPIDEPYLPRGMKTSEFGPIDVGRNEIFVMGDNRGNSDDSRTFGPIRADSVVGHAFALIWPPGNVRGL